MASNGAHDDDPRDELDELRERIRSGDLCRGERDQLDQLVFTVVLAELRADKAVRDFPGEVAVQRALAAEAWTRVAAQLHVMLGQEARQPDNDVLPLAPGHGHDPRGPGAAGGAGAGQW